MSTAGVYGVDRSNCPAQRHGEYWMRNKFGCVCFDTRLDYSRYRHELARGVRRIVSATAATRIAQGLARHGFTAAEIAAMGGISLRAVRQLQAGTKPTLWRSHDVALREAADRVRLDVVRVGDGPNRARNAARRNGWLPLTAWDDDTLDDPAASPRLGLPVDDDVDDVVVERVLAGERLRLNRAERLAAARKAAAGGMGVQHLSELLHVSFTAARTLLDSASAESEPELIAS